MNISLSSDSNIFIGEQPFTFNVAGSDKVPKPIDSETYYESIDLISEGPIEGLTDSFGNTLNYVDLTTTDTTTNNSSLSYGVYFNDIPIRDIKSKRYNISSSNGSLNFGSENPFLNTQSSSIYEYKTKIYDLDSFGFTLWETDLTNNLKSWNNGTLNETYLRYIQLEDVARVFSHYVKNKYTSSIKVIISIDELFYVDKKGQNQTAPISFIVSVKNSFKQESVYLLFSGRYFSKQNASFISFNISITEEDKFGLTNPEFIVNVYSISNRIPALATGGILVRNFSVNSVIEYLGYNFSYPFSAYCKTQVSSKHFSSIPVRSFDAKLLKVLVPDNYDSEAREYVGDWSGNFSKTLRWTDNPAWIFYDLCTNSRYGLARSFISQNDINKWELLKISKYCDELLKTNCATKYSAQDFSYVYDLKFGDKFFNTVFINTTETLQQLLLRYPIGGILYLYDLKDRNKQDIDLNVKKVILTVATSGTVAAITLTNDFGPRRFIESDRSGIFFEKLKAYLSNDPSNLNIENYIKTYAVSYISSNTISISNTVSKDQQVSIDFSSKEIFDTTLKVASGKCVAKHESFDEFLEPRFSANLIINNESEGLKILSDLSSIFRGIFYFNNGFLNLTSDVPKNTTYVFNNANVKDGLFTYTSSQLNSSYSVAKVSYSDKNDNFKDKIVYVEDPELIEKLGIVETEILGFGVTSKYQAYRLGKWFLATQKLESETVSFSGGVEISMLKISDVIRISDALKNSNLIYGKITSIDVDNNYIYIDREVSEDSLGKLVKLFCLINNELNELTFFVESVDNTNLRLKLTNKAYVSWNIVQKVIVSDNNRTISGDNDGGASWTRKCFSKQSYTDNCQISFNVVYPATYLVCGLSEINNPTIDETDIQYGFYVANGDLYIINNGSYGSVVASNIKKTDLLKIIFDGKNILYYINNTLLSSGSRNIGIPLYAVAAFNTPYASVNNVNFSPYPDYEYGNFAYLRSGASFTIYLKNYTDDGDLYRLISISENSVNDYSISALKYSKQKFDYVEKDQYIDSFQNDKKQIIFSSDNYISAAFTDSEIESFFNLKYLFDRSINYAKSTNKVYDYFFPIESETLISNYSQYKYKELKIDFVSIYKNSKIAANLNVYGLKCIITKDGKTLTFTIDKNNAKFIEVFLGEISLSQSSFSPQYSIDFYAYDKNKKLILV